jgi:plasmid stability protein
MKNITVSVDDEIYHKARIKAAEMKSSISALVKQFLTKVVNEESEFDRLKREEQALRESLRHEGVVFSASHRLSREELHDRHAFR